MGNCNICGKYKCSCCVTPPKDDPTKAVWRASRQCGKTFSTFNAIYPDLRSDEVNKEILLAQAQIKIANAYFLRKGI